MKEKDLMSDIVSPLVYQLGVGGVGGFLVGYTIKKVSKLIVVLIGLFIVLLLYLGTSEIITVNYTELWNALVGLLGLAGQTATWFVSLVSVLPFMGSFIAGLLLGLKLG